MRELFLCQRFPSDARVCQLGVSYVRGRTCAHSQFEVGLEIKLRVQVYVCTQRVAGELIPSALIWALPGDSKGTSFRSCGTLPASLGVRNCGEQAHVRNVLVVYIGHHHGASSRDSERQGRPAAHKQRPNTGDTPYGAGTVLLFKCACKVAGAVRIPSELQ